jgi:hypothetical protein
MVFGGPKSVFGLDGAPIDIRTVKTRHIDWGHDITGQDPSQGRVQGHFLGRKRSEVERRLKAALGFVAVDDIEELLLLHCCLGSGGKVIYRFALARETINQDSPFTHHKDKP